MKTEEARRVLLNILQNATKIYTHRQQLIDAGILEKEVKRLSFWRSFDPNIIKLIDSSRHVIFVFDRDKENQKKITLRMAIQKLDNPFDEFFSIGDEYGIRPIGDNLSVEIDVFQLWYVYRGSHPLRSEVRIVGGLHRKGIASTGVDVVAQDGKKIVYVHESEVLVAREGHAESESKIRSHHGTFTIRGWQFPIEYLKLDGHITLLRDNVVAIAQQIGLTRSLRYGPYR